MLKEKDLIWSLKVSSVHEKWFQFFPQPALVYVWSSRTPARLVPHHMNRSFGRTNIVSQHGCLAHLGNVYLVCFRDVLVAHVKKLSPKILIFQEIPIRLTLVNHYFGEITNS